MQKLLVAVCLTALSCQASANIVIPQPDNELDSKWIFGLSYLSASYKGQADVSFNAAVGSVAYPFDLKNGVSLVPELKAGPVLSDIEIKYNDTTQADQSFSADYYVGLALRAQVAPTHNTYAFIGPVVTNASIEDYIDEIESDTFSDDLPDTWAFGFGFGGGVNINDTIDLEVSFENINHTNIGSVGLKYNF